MTRLVPQIVAITLFRLLLNTGRRFVYPFAPALSRGLDVPLTMVTTVIAGAQFTSLLGLFSGPFADRFGYRRMMRAGLATLAIGMLLCGLATHYWVVFIGLLVASLGKTIFDPAVQAFIGQHVPYARRGRIIGVIETAWAGSTLMGIPALGLIIDHLGLQSSFLVLGLLGAVAWLVIARVIVTDDAASTGERQRVTILAALGQLVRVRPAVGMLAFGFFVSMANDSLFVIYGAWFENAFAVSLTTLGFSTIAIGLAELFGESLTALFADRIGLKMTMVIGMVLAIAAYLALPALAFSLASAMAGMFCIFAAFEFTIVTSFSLSTEVLPQSRATMMAGFYATAGIGRMIGVMLGGVLWETGGISMVCGSAAVFTALGLIAVWWGLHGWKQAD